MPSQDEKQIGTIVFYAQLNGTEPVVTGEYIIYEDDLDGREIEEFLRNTGVDWAYEAVHSDNLRYWAELKNE